MTRDEAKKWSKVYSSDLDLDTIIDTIYNDFESKFTRVEIISSLGRVFCSKCDNGKHYELSIQDDGKTLKLFIVKDK